MPPVMVQLGCRAWNWACHVFVVCISFWAAWLLRDDFSISGGDLVLVYWGLAIAVAVKFPVFHLMLDQERWRYLGVWDLAQLAQANVLGSALAASVIYFSLGPAFPVSICCLDLLICFLLSGGLRFAVRIYGEIAAGKSNGGTEKGLLVYGAGVAGIALAREIRMNPKLGYRVTGFLDDDPRKHGARLLGLPVLGSGEDAAKVLEMCRKRQTRVDEIVVAMPSASGRQIRAAVIRGRAAGVPCRIVPGLGELISGKLTVGKMREVSVTDLLAREPVKLELDGVRRAIAGRSVMVTGAAGSIGSELCNQLAQLEPRRLVALDQAESELFRLEAELRDRYPALDLAPEIGDIRDPRRIHEIIEQHAVNSIYHAAAYKHVPVMEGQVCEAVRNNVIGTWNLVQAAWRANVSNLLLISTDKAVNPTSVMGLTKRAAELIVSARRPSLAPGQGTKFVCVRFGNVLVSNGSVVPIFQKQIAAGGPVTVTHPEMRRYFMTVQEAVHLVLRASVMGTGSEIFVLDMGKPVRILDLARKMITLAGLVPDDDIDIRFTGLRPGEKMFEELNLAAENLLPTSHEKIRIFQGRQVALNELVPWISGLQNLLWRRDAEKVIAQLREMIPEYQPAPAPTTPEVEQVAARQRGLAAAAGAY